jgi:transposase
VSNDRGQYFANSEIHNINTRHTPNLHLPSTHLNMYQKRVYYLCIKIFDSLPQDIKTYINNPRTFKKAVKIFLYKNFFYSLNEYYDNNNIKV